MRVKLKGEHPAAYTKVEVKPGLFLSIGKRFHNIPDDYYDVIRGNSWIEIEGLPEPKAPVKEVKVKEVVVEEPIVDVVDEVVPVPKKKGFFSL